MKKIKISILGSTGSIGTTTLDIIKKKSSYFQVNILSANKNYSKIIKIIKEFKPKIFIINNYKIYKKIKKKYSQNKKLKIYNNFNYSNLEKRKNDITVSSISGIAGLSPTLIFAKNSKKLLLANKESIICGWPLIVKVAKKYKTEVIPVDSEHFSIFELIKNENKQDIDKIYLTASGGPFVKVKKKLSSIKPKEAIKHPNWKMGKNISINSSNLMNKIFEIIEAKKIFDLPYNKFDIIIHPQSLIHGMIKYKNGLMKLLYHSPDMAIPLSNAIFNNKILISDLGIKDKISELKNLEFSKPKPNQFPSIGILQHLSKNLYSTPIIINGANEILVELFLQKKIKYNQITQCLFTLLKDKKYKKYAIQVPKNLNDIIKIDKWSREFVMNRYGVK